jgi:hypothetical protein
MQLCAESQCRLAELMHRWSVTAQHSTEYVPQDSNLQYDALVFEIFGFISSSEGAAAAILDLRQRQVISTRCITVPARAATFFAPVHLVDKAVNEASSGNELYISTKLALVRRLNFNRSKMSTALGVFEQYDFSTTTTGVPGVQSELTRFIIDKHGLCQGFGLFVALAAPGPDGLRSRHWPMSTAHAEWCRADVWISSNVADNAYARAWRNPIALFPSALELAAGDRLVVTTVVDSRGLQPVYSIAYEVLQTGAVSGCNMQGVLSFTLADLYPQYTRQV